MALTRSSSLSWAQNWKSWIQPSLSWMRQLATTCDVQASGHSTISLDVEEQEQKSAKRQHTYYVFVLGIAGSPPPARMPPGLLRGRLGVASCR